MSKLPSKAADEALAQALQLARTPSVPDDLAARIVTRVTELPQPTAEQQAALKASGARSGGQRALAAALGTVVIIGAVALSGLWPAGNSPGSEKPALAASAGKSGEPSLAVNGSVEVARSEPEIVLRAPGPKPGLDDTAELAAVPGRTVETLPHMGVPLGEPSTPIAPYEVVAPEPTVELAAQPPAAGSSTEHTAVEVAAGPVGRTVPNGSDSGSDPTSNLPGLPRSQGLGITDAPSASPSPVRKSGPVGQRQPRPRR